MATATVAATPFSSPAAQQASLHAQSAQFSAARQRLLGRFGASQDGGDPLLTGSAQLAVSAVSPQRPASGVWTRGALTGASGVGSMYTNGLGVESVVGGARSVMGMSALRVSKYEAAASRAGDGAHAVATSTSTSMPMRNSYSAAIRATSPVHRMRRTGGGGGQEQSLTPEQKLSNTRVEHERMLARCTLWLQWPWLCTAGATPSYVATHCCVFACSERTASTRASGRLVASQRPASTGRV